jgi:hypothetical protein
MLPDSAAQGLVDRVFECRRAKGASGLLEDLVVDVD